MTTTDTYNRKSAMEPFNHTAMEVTEWKNGEDSTVSIDVADRNILSDITIEEPDIIY